MVKPRSYIETQIWNPDTRTFVLDHRHLFKNNESQSKDLHFVMLCSSFEVEDMEQVEGSSLDDRENDAEPKFKVL